ncbi:MAG: hypothetical protein KBA03_06040 [Anaerolineaceae bacterium]|nr:hypothetical protein [Anaerolineaceae bacterium]
MENFIARIKDKLQVPRNLAIAAAVVGVIVGLAIGYLFPIPWTDASAANLRPDLRIEYLRNAITTYTLTGDRLKAVQSYEELGKEAESTLTELAANPGFLNSEQIQRYTTAINVPLSPSEPAQTIPGTGQGGQTEDENNEGSFPVWLALVLLGVLVVGAYLAWRHYLKDRGLSFKDFGSIISKNKGEETMAQSAPPAAVRRTESQAATPSPAVREVRENKPAAQRVSLFANGETIGNAKASNINANGEKPVAQFMSTYLFGDDRYDESFIFDAPNGAFLGECGISISDLIGVGEPKKISAFDVWLFDKNDIQTVTKVIMSKHAFNDQNIKSRLEIRGEPILAEPGKLFRLETATLRMEGRIVDVSYGDLPLPDDSYFQRNTIELAVYRK